MSNPLRFAPSVRRRSRSEQGWEESCGREVVVGYMGEGTPLEEKLLLEVLPELVCYQSALVWEAASCLV